MELEHIQAIGHTIESLAIMSLSILEDDKLESEPIDTDDLSRLADILHEINEIGNNLSEGTIDGRHLPQNWPY